MLPIGVLAGTRQAGFDIANSGAFVSEDNAKLNRTFDAGDRKKWTLSLWIKRPTLDSIQFIFGADNHPSDDYMYFNSANKITFYQGGAASGNISTDRVFRDNANFYHIVFQFDSANVTAADRSIIFVNGERADVTVNTPVTLNYNGKINHIYAHQFGDTADNNGWDADQYLSEVNFIGGALIDPSEFAELDANNQWVAKEYTGTYGTNGFYLNFQNGSDLGEDSSGNGNDFINSGVTQSTDTPTDNYAILNVNEPHNATYASIQEAGRYANLGTGVGTSLLNTMSVKGGKYYWEISAAVITIGVQNGLTTGVSKGITTHSDRVAGGLFYVSADGNKSIFNVASAYGSAWTLLSDVIGIAVDSINGTIEFFKNGVSQGVINELELTTTDFFPCIANNSSGGGSATELFVTEDSWTYSAPSGFRALSTKNLPEPDIVLSKDYFKALAYDDGAGAKTVGFQPDLVWMKSRGSAFNHKLVDSDRGATKAWQTSAVTIELTEATGLTSFDSNGFTVGADTDYSDTTGDGMVAWSWKKGATPGFDIVPYSGNETIRTISHSLGVKPAFIMTEILNKTYQNRVYHQALGATKHVTINSTAASVTSSVNWDDTEPTASVFTLGAGLNVNEIGTDNFIAYLFAEIEGFSKFGVYTGNGSADGPFVNLGFRPAHVMVKRIDSAGSWLIRDSGRETENGMSIELFAENPTGDIDSGRNMDFLSNGFKWRVASDAGNFNGGTYIFMAFAEAPLKYSRAR